MRNRAATKAATASKIPASRNANSGASANRLGEEWLVFMFNLITNYLRQLKDYFLCSSSTATQHRRP